MRVVCERAVTNGIQVEVESSFVPKQSDAAAGQYFFSYRIKIRNSRPREIQLVSRHWVITDGEGRVEEINGAGVVGQQPCLGPGQAFEYESFCPLETPTGTMRGTYMIVCLESGESFEAEIPQLFLVEPNSYH